MKFLILLLFTFSCYLSGTEHVPNESILSQKLNNAIQLPVFSEAETVFLSSKEIVEVVQPILKAHLNSTNYDRIFPILQFLDHYEECKKIDKTITPIEAYKTFKFQPLMPDSRGGACVSLTFHIYQSLPSYLKGYMAIAKLPNEFQQIGFPKYSHTAVLIKYENPNNLEDKGYVLLDSGFDIDKPLVIKSNGEPVFYETQKKGTWKFFLKDNKIICEIINKKNQEYNDSDDQSKMIYFTQCLLNPIEASAMPMIVADRRLSLLSRRENGFHLAHLNIELNRERVIWDQENERFDPIQFQEFCQNNWVFPSWFAEKLYTTSPELTSKILRVIQNKPILDSLYLNYMNILKETQDTSITGDLNFEKIDEIIKIIHDQQTFQ